MNTTTHDADVIVVGAGPAGSCAALRLAQSGRRVILVERGPFPGSKNMYGGVVYPRILDELIPSWWETAPIQRWVVRRSTMILSDTGATVVVTANALRLLRFRPEATSASL